VEEIFSLIRQEIIQSGMENYVSAGVVLTGGGVLLDGITEVAERVLNLSTRIGKPMGMTGLVDVVNNPMYATAVGLVLYGARKHQRPQFRIRDKHIFDRVMTRMKKWFREIL
ncbi:MAG: cell division FtsA domain-containing protein, partial [Pseudomonadota bacterium]